MHVGIFTNTPAHVHLYREAVKQLRDRGHRTSVFARDDECTLALLSYHDIPHHVYGSRDATKLGLIHELPRQARTIANLVRDAKPDIIFGMGVYSTYAATLVGADAVTVMDSEPTATKQRLSAPLVEAILTPSTFGRYLGRKHYAFHGLKETAYLHPEVFDPDPYIHAELDIGPEDPYSIVRFNAFNGHHDVGQRGFTPRQKHTLVRLLADHGTVFVSDEAGRISYDEPGIRRYEAHPARMHDAIAGAQLLIADTQTMVTESALIGTPTIRSNSFVGNRDMGNFKALERAGLVFNRSAFSDVLTDAESLLEDPDTRQRWRHRRDAFIGDKCNLTALLVELVDGVATGKSVAGVVDHHPSLYRRHRHDGRTVHPRVPVKV